MPIATRTTFLVKVDANRVAVKIGEAAWRKIKYVQVKAGERDFDQATDLQLQNLRALFAGYEDDAEEEHEAGDAEGVEEACT